MHSAAKLFNVNARDNFETCFGSEDDKTAPCYATSAAGSPDTCTCKIPTDLATGCANFEGKTCSLDMHYVAPSGLPFESKDMVQACFPTACENSDVKSITQFVIDEWITNTTAGSPGIVDDRLTDIVVPSSCGKEKSSSSVSKDGEIAGAVVGVLLLAGAVVGCFMYSKRSGTVGGLNTKFMVSSRQNRGAL